MSSDPHARSATGGGAQWSRRRVLVAGAAGLGGLLAVARLGQPTTASAGRRTAPVAGTGPIGPNLLLNPSFQDGGIGRSIPAWSVTP